MAVYSEQPVICKVAQKMLLKLSGVKKQKCKPIGFTRAIWYKNRQGLCESQAREAQLKLQELASLSPHQVSLDICLWACFPLADGYLCSLSAFMWPNKAALNNSIGIPFLPSLPSQSTSHYLPDWVSWPTRSCNQSTVLLSTNRCPNSYTLPVSCKLNYKCFHMF